MSSEEQTNEGSPVSSSGGNPYLVPGAIVVAGLFVAGAIFATQGGDSGAVAAQTGRTLEATVLPVTDEDRVFGSKDADVFFIEYSDYRCGYCGLFHATIMDILEKYDGKVAWVYRHTPYQPGGKEATMASECIADLAGEDAFWEYTDRVFNNQKELSPDWSLATALELGVDQTAYEECVASDRYDEKILSHVQNAQELGGQGTPFTVLLTKNGDMVKFSGAQPIERVALFVERALKSLES